MGLKTGMEKANASRRNWKKAAVVAFLACPGSFVLGGLAFQRVLEWVPR